MSKFIRSIGSMYVNRQGVDLYENKDGSATLRPTKIGGHDLPIVFWKKFNSIDDAESFIEEMKEERLTTAGLVLKLFNFLTASKS